MICRPTDEGWMLISQVAHARLAGELARAWKGDFGLPPMLRGEFLLAVTRHDEGWWSWQQSPEIQENGEPRGFTDMPMETSTAIWSDSIDALRPAAGAVPPAPAVDGLPSVAGWQAPFSVDELVDLSYSREDGPWAESEIQDRVAELTEAGIVEAVPQTEPAEYRLAQPATSATAYPALWVSRHFMWLAEQAAQHREPDSADAQACRKFIAQQSAFVDEHVSAADGEACDAEFVETGYRWLQFFDWLSLWLCMRERTEAGERPLPGGELAMRITPLATDRFAVDPYPFPRNELRVAISGRFVAERTFGSHAALQAALAQAERRRLVFTLVPATPGRASSVAKFNRSPVRGSNRSPRHRAMQADPFPGKLIPCCRD